MATNILPFVRQMLVCEHVGVLPDNPRKVTIFGLLTTIHATAFPVHVGFCVYLLLTEGRQSGIGRIMISDADSDEIIYMGQSHHLKFDGDPLHVHAFSFRVVDCEFPSPGPYWVEFRFNEVVLSQELLLVR